MPIALGSTIGLDETRTKPLSVIGHVAHPAEPFAVNHARIAAWCTCESQASATSALTSSSASGSSILVECSPHHLWRDWRRTGRHTDNRQSVVGLDPSGGQPSTGKLRDYGAKRALLPDGKLPRNRDDILVDVQGCPHNLMLAHHRIKFCNANGSR
jgi:hypothetical protein